MQCHLCEQDKSNLCKAHIVPESFFRFMYPNGRVEGDSLIMVADNKEFTSNFRIGFYDTSILCIECDGRLGRFDEYGKYVFIDLSPKLLKKVNTGDAWVFENIDVPRLKLFLLSVLWRYSISNLSYLKSFKLPSKFEDQIRDMIITNNAGDLNDFSVVISRFDYVHTETGLNKYFQLPIRTRIGDGLNYINMYLPNGYKIIIKIDSRPQGDDLIPITLNFDRPAYIIRYEKFEETPEFQKLLQNSYKVKHKTN